MRSVKWLGLCAALALTPCIAADAPVAIGAAQFVMDSAALPPPDDAAWQPVALPDDWHESRPGANGFGWYRLPFARPTSPELLAIYISRACTNLEVFVNGDLVGSGGRLVEPVTRNCYHPQLFTVPAAALREGVNTVHVRLYGHAFAQVAARLRAGGLSEVWVGPERLLRPVQEAEYFWRITASQVVCMTLTVLAGLMLALWTQRRRDTVYLHFACLLAGWPVISARFLLRDWPVPNATAEMLIVSLFPPVVAAASAFVLRYAELRLAWFERLAWALCALVPASLALGGVNRVYALASFWYTVLALEFAAAVAFYILRTWRTRRTDWFVMVGGLALIVVLVALEILMQLGFAPIPTRHRVQFAMPLLFVAIGLRLIHLFVRALAESLNTRLEERIAEKSAEIERGYAELARAQQDAAAAHERARIAADLHDDIGSKLLTLIHRAERTPLAELARGAMQDLRDLIAGLDARAEPVGDALADWRAEIQDRCDAAGVALEWRGPEECDDVWLGPRERFAAERIVREAVSNALRHSGCDRLWIDADVRERALRLAIVDNGPGADPAAWKPGHGLHNMQRRASAAGGAVAWSSACTPLGATGTRVNLSLPLETPDSATQGQPE